MSDGHDGVDSIALADESIKLLEKFLSREPHVAEAACRIAQRGGRYVLPLLHESAEAISRFRSGAVSAIKFTSLFRQSSFPSSPIMDAASPTEFSLRVNRLLFSVIGALGYLPAGYATEAYGALPQNITPTGSNKSLETMTTAKCQGHTDVCDGLFPFEATSHDEIQSPEILALLCIRNPASVPTFVLPLKRILSNLSLDQTNLLQQELFHVLPQESFARSRKGRDLALLVYHKGRAHFRYSNSKISTTNPDAADVLKAVHSIVQAGQSESRILLRPGDLLIINNRTALHGREDIAAKFDGSDRWLIRSYGFSAVAWMMKTAAGREDMFEF